MKQKRYSQLAHWGAYTAVVEDGRLVRCEPFERDAAPSPLLGSIVPLVYGKKLRVSSFVVFVALLAAGLIGGVEGAIVVLPIVASYPIIERIWLKPYLRRETIAVHEAVEEEDRDHGRDYSSSRRSILF